MSSASSTCSLPAPAGCGTLQSPPPASSSCSGEFRALAAASRCLSSRPAGPSPSIQSLPLSSVAACGTAALWHAASAPNPFPVEFNSCEIWKVSAKMLYILVITSQTVFRSSPLRILLRTIVQ